jgi:hypothetical protein
MWHYYNDRVLAFSNSFIRSESDQARYTHINKITFTQDDDRYIRPPGAVDSRLLRHLQKDTQTVSEFLTVLFDITRDDLVDSYNPDSCYFDSREELAQVLDEEIPRVAFFVTASEWPVNTAVIHVLTQEQVGRSDLRELKMWMAMDIIEDLRVILAVNELCLDHATPVQGTSFGRELLTSVEQWHDTAVQASEPLHG